MVKYSRWIYENRLINRKYIGNRCKIDIYDRQVWDRLEIDRNWIIVDR